jgi:hypothetical protein
MRIPKFKSEKAEADWLYANRVRIEAAMAREKRTKGPSPAQIVAREAESKMISIRLAAGDIERAKELAASKGIGYQTLIRMLIHESLDRPRT